MFGVLVGTGRRRSYLRGGASAIPILNPGETSREVLAAWLAATNEKLHRGLRGLRPAG